MLRFTSQIVRNLFSGPATRPYPANPREPFPQLRGELENTIEDCIFCGMCSRKCPSSCIEVDKNTGTWTWDPGLCVYCGICTDHCPTKCLKQITVYRAPFTVKELVTLKGTPPAKKKKD